MKALKPILGTFSLLAIFVTVPGGLLGQAESRKIKPGKKYEQSGAKLSSPNEPDWSVVKSESTETSFTKAAKDKKFKAFVKTAQIPIYDNNNELLVNLEKLKMAEVDEAIRDSIHFYYTEYKSTSCLQYDGIFNPPDTGHKYLNINGYICRHPDNKGTIIQFEFSIYSNDRGYLKPESQLSKSFFEDVQFTKLK